MNPLIKLKIIASRYNAPYGLYLKWQRLVNPKFFSYSDAFWERSRGLHKGRPGFVVGNGPSLRMEDLDKLSSQISIASNKIYLAFPSTKWRPTYYSVADWLVWPKIANEVPKYFRNPMLLSTFNGRSFPPETILLSNLGPCGSGENNFSLDSRKGQFGGFTVTYNNLQTAAHLGLNPIYLIGCDHYYGGEDGATPNAPFVVHSGKSNHFIPNYRAPGEVVAMAPIKEMNQAFACARRVCENRGIKIYNATRGGFLEVFERMELDEVIGNLPE